MITYIIIDDEPLAHELIEEFCGMLPHWQLKKNCYNALEAMQFLSQQSVDLMFLDLNMPRLKGFDFLKTLSNPPKVIVTTAYKEFALEGYELNVADYLLKPFSFERFVKAVNKATTALPRQVGVAGMGREEAFRFFVKGDKKYHQVDAGDIVFIEAYGNYTRIHLEKEMILSHEKISYFEELLPADAFMRIHKSFVVALKKIRVIEGNQVMIGGHRIPVGQTYKAGVSRLYGGNS